MSIIHNNVVEALEAQIKEYEAASKAHQKRGKEFCKEGMPNRAEHAFRKAYEYDARAEAVKLALSAVKREFGRSKEIFIKKLIAASR